MNDRGTDEEYMGLKEKSGSSSSRSPPIALLAGIWTIVSLSVSTQEEMDKCFEVLNGQSEHIKFTRESHTMADERDD
ncbi:hypothetical protein KIN20_007858 [Parelaphostrongylus tenuis]|uniref:Uncharacterized protein n=1 Tax=Parelaphostrongylus tenuis TaxID=148309 RepID=A0AAD5QH38_PARTN|nr:hypothetical protein KIN20_007858 [Parelaphostrongylus tenuis]